jgi:hypothetical protein
LIGVLMRYDRIAYILVLVTVGLGVLLMAFVPG